MTLISYSAASSYSLNAMTLVGHDANPNDGASGSAGSNGMSYEAIYGPFRWCTLNARYERTNDGLGTLQDNYVADLAFTVMPNLIVTLGISRSMPVTRSKPPVPPKTALLSHGASLQRNIRLRSVKVHTPTAS